MKDTKKSRAEVKNKLLEQWLGSGSRAGALVSKSLAAYFLLDARFLINARSSGLPIRIAAAPVDAKCDAREPEPELGPSGDFIDTLHRLTRHEESTAIRT